MEVPHKDLGTIAPELGLRAAFFPISFLGAEAEVGLMPASVEGDQSALLYGLRAHLIGQMPSRLTPFFVIGGGTLSVSSDEDALGDDSDMEFHWGLGAKWYATDWLLLRVDGRHILSAALDGIIGDTRGITSHWEALVGLSVVLGGSRPGDSDGDGFADDEDDCPEDPGKPPRGCPADRDGDGVIDSKDKCPDDPGVEPEGCPADRDGDGVIDSKDKCPDDPGVEPDGGPQVDKDLDKDLGKDLDKDGDTVEASRDMCPGVAGVPPDGCPVKDADGDGVRDEEDKCPKEPESANGYQDSDGCPDALPKAVKKYSGVIRGIKFESGKAAIQTKSYRTLDEAVRVLTEYPGIRIRIEGHTDSNGAAEDNRKLSARRAEAVRKYLIAKDIDSARLETKGYGEDEPVASNETQEGRQKNRRIEFTILQ